MLERVLPKKRPLVECAIRFLVILGQMFSFVKLVWACIRPDAAWPEWNETLGVAHPRASACRPFAHTNTFKSGVQVLSLRFTIKLPPAGWQRGPDLNRQSQRCRPQTVDLVIDGKCSVWSENLSVRAALGAASATGLPRLKGWWGRESNPRLYADGPMPGVTPSATLAPVVSQGYEDVSRLLQSGQKMSSCPAGHCASRRTSG